MKSGMAMTTKHLSDGWISQHIGRHDAFIDTLEEFAFGNNVMNMHRVFTAAILCVFAAGLTVSPFQGNHFFSPLKISNGPTIRAMENEGMFASAMSQDVFGNADRGTFHHVSNVDRPVTAASANVIALMAGNPLDSFRGQPFTSKVVPVDILWRTDGLAMFSSRHGNDCSASTSATLSSMDREPLINGLTGCVFIAKTISHFKSLALGELLEPLPGRAEGNQQGSLKYTSGTFRDYRRGTVPLITDTSAQVRKFHSGHDIVRTFEKSREYSSTISKIRKFLSRACSSTMRF